MEKDLTQLVFMLEKSGSMYRLDADNIGGYNSLIEKQKKESSEDIVSTLLFNSSIEIIHNDYIVSGCTALLDTISNTIQNIKKVHSKLKDNKAPSKTLFVITTDGMENDSREYFNEQIKEMIKKEKESDWEFKFLGENIDDVSEASIFGIDSENAVNYNCYSKGVDLNL